MPYPFYQIDEPDLEHNHDYIYDIPPQFKSLITEHLYKEIIKDWYRRFHEDKIVVQVYTIGRDNKIYLDETRKDFENSLKDYIEIDEICRDIDKKQ
jgi:hypothetical protein